MANTPAAVRRLICSLVRSKPVVAAIVSENSKGAVLRPLRLIYNVADHPCWVESSVFAKDRG
jgi:hypothetical protein